MTTPTPKTALITGNTGQDGPYLAEFLLEKGSIMHGIKRRASSFNTARVYHIYQDPHTGHAQWSKIQASPRRGETFVTRKITQGLANISQGLEDCLCTGNIDALRDWGHAKDYVRMQWMMLQQDQPEDFAIATDVQYSVRQFINWTAETRGMQLRWQGEGVNEKGYWLNPLHYPLSPRERLGLS